MTGISVVIITRGRVGLVDRLLISLIPARARLEGPCEVIVVDDSAPDDARALSEACARNDTRFVEADAAHVSAKRNQGARTARYPLVLFLDSDCVATPELLTAHAEAYADPAVHSVLGLVEFTGAITQACAAVDLTPFAWGFAYPLHHDDVSWGPSANLSVRAESFLSVGGFDESFPQRPGGEDVDLCLRLTARFGRIRCERQAKAFHERETWSGFRTNLRRFYNWGYADRYLVVRHGDRTFLDLPRLPVLAALAMVAAVGLAALHTSVIWLIPGLILIPLAALLDGLAELPGSGPRRAFHRVMAHLYFASNELGCLVAFIRHGELNIAATRLHFGRNQQYGEWIDSGRRVRAVFAAWLLGLAMVGWLGLLPR